MPDKHHVVQRTKNRHLLHIHRIRGGGVPSDASGWNEEDLWGMARTSDIQVFSKLRKLNSPSLF
jgi:hypothetical protein